MKRDVFSDLKYDPIDAVDFDVIDAAELDTEDKILFSKELHNHIKEEIEKHLSLLPKVIKTILNEQISKQTKNYSNLIEREKSDLESQVYRTKTELRNELEKIRKELRDKYVEYRNILLSQERYTFGGFAPPNPLTGAVGSVLQNSNQTWAGLVWGAASSNPVYIPDSTTEGSWRLFNDGTNLVVQVLISGVWREGGAFTRP